MTTFISYSRVNSEFVVRLAKDLKAAGFDVWLDQLDIPKGARWDDAIEAAVERSSTFMIVLAPESIESQNVKDELSYAIDSGKHILPVVIRPCKIPLRLRRFQYVDFTDKPYKESLADIKRLLGNTQRLTKPPPQEPVHEQGEPSPLVKGPLVSPERMSLPELFQKDEPDIKRGFPRFVIPVSLAVIALATLAAVAVFALNRNAPPASTPSVTFTSTQVPPTLTSTITPIPPRPQVTDERGVTLRLVSAGDFTLGNETGMADEQPVQILFLDNYYIDKYEVTNLMYRACVQAGGCVPPKRANSPTRTSYYNNPEFNNYPVVYVDWNMARSYCEWRGARLPTEAEWEKAARGPEGNTYPWGEAISCKEANFFGCQKDTASVSSFETGLSAYGVHNMAGNVSEWVSSLYMPYPYDLFDGREDLEAPGERVIRGGSWLSSDSENELRSASRQKADPATTDANIGFRCARTPDGSLMDVALIANTPQNPSTATAIAATSRSRKTREPQDAVLGAAPSPTSVINVTRTEAASPIPSKTAQGPTVTVPVTTESPPTDVPPTDIPPTDIPPSDVPPTDIPPTDIPPTDVPPTDVPPTDVPPTDVPSADTPTGP